MLNVIFLAQFALYRALTAMNPRQMFWGIMLVYTVGITVVTVPGILPDNIDVLISRIQNGVTVAVVSYIARTPFPVAQTPPLTRQGDPPIPGA